MKRGKLFVLALISFTSAASAQGALGQKAGVLCAYVIYSGAKLDSEVCGWATTPVGKVVHKGVDDMEAYISANSSLPVSEYRSNYDKRLSVMQALSEIQRSAYCAGQDPDRPNYFGATRFEEPQEVADEISILVGRPGSVGYGDCF